MNESVRGMSPRDKETRKAFVYRHVVSFEETNLVGNVYFARHVAWQGRCREMFLKEHTPNLVNEIRNDLRLITLRVACEYFEELMAFDSIQIEMRLESLQSNRIGLEFTYILKREASEIYAAKGFQEVGCFRARDGSLKPCQIPSDLAAALNFYS